MTINVPELLTAMAARLEDVNGIASAHYPAPNYIDASECPAVVLYWGGDQDTLIEPDMNEETWLPAIMARVMVPRDGDTPQEFAKVDALLTPIVDAFPIGTVRLDGISGNVDVLYVNRLRPSLQVGYADSQYYAAEVYFRCKFHRPQEVN